MAKKNVSFLDLFVEKIVVGVCALAFLGAAGYYFIGTPYAVDDKSPKELLQHVRTEAEKTARAALSARVPDAGSDGSNPEDEALRKLARWFGDAREGLIPIAGIEPVLPRARPFPPSLAPVQEIAEEDRHGLAALVAPGPPVVLTGRTTIDLPRKVSLLEVIQKGPSTQTESVTRSWVSVGAQVDLFEQWRAFRTKRYTPGQSTSVLITRVHLQRRVVDDPTADWEDVEPYSPCTAQQPPVLEFGRDGKQNPTSSRLLDGYRKMIQAAQDILARPSLPGQTLNTRGDPIVTLPLPYLDSPPGGESDLQSDGTDASATNRVREWTRLAEAALRGGRPFKERDLDAACILASAAVGTRNARKAEADRARKVLDEVAAELKQANKPASPREPEMLMPIVAHDLDVVPGRTYVYRLRFEAANTFAGEPAWLTDPADARKLTLLSDWSPPSRPVDVESDLYVYFTKADRDKSEATVTVFRKERSDIQKEKYDVKVGDPIGRSERKRGRSIDFATGLVCIDIDFERGPDDAALVVADLNDGGVRELILSKDRVDRRYLEWSKR